MMGTSIVHNVKDFDLNHARALHYLLEEAHVTRAAKKLGITPAAASNALHRLRRDFDDPLLVRSGRTLLRTPRAEALRQPARDVMAAATQLFAQDAFDPATADWEIVVTTSDRVAELLLPKLDRLLRARAPRARLRMRTSMIDVVTYLRDHGGFAIVPPTRERALRLEPLFREDFLCVLRAGHPLGKAKLTVRRFAALEHAIVAPIGASARSIIDALLEREGFTRNVTRVVMSFSLLLPLIVESDRVAVIPRTLSAQAQSLGLQLRPIPVAMPTAEMSLAWHIGSDRDPKHVWTRQLFHEAVKGLRLQPAAAR